MSKNSIPEKNCAVNGKSTTDIDYLSEAAESLITPDEIEKKKREEEIARVFLDKGAHDESNAQCVHIHQGGRFAYNDSHGWMAFDGVRWQLHGASAALDRGVVETLQERAVAIIKSGKMDEYEKVLKKCTPSASNLSGAKTLLSSLAYVPVEDFDNDPNKLNCLNGIVDLRTGKIEPHSPERRFMHCTKVAYKPDADQSDWKDWLVATVGEEQAAYLQLAIGYTATGYTREEVLFYLFGPPRSGKGTFTETIKHLLGEPLAAEVSFSTFTAARSGDSQNFDLAPLKPCRYVAASESNAYERFDEARIKALTGGNEIYCAFKHRNHFGYKPQFKIWLSSNHPVNADPDDDAVWGRIRVIEFPHSNLGREDKSLKWRMLSAEVLEGVLAWIIEGAMKWYALGEAGLREIESSSSAKAEQRSDLDNVQAWINECCVEAEFGAVSLLYLSYEKWCRENGVDQKKNKGFSQALIKKGYKKDRITAAPRKTVRGFRGINLA